jgi:hypothetical protein
MRHTHTLTNSHTHTRTHTHKHKTEIWDESPSRQWHGSSISKNKFVFQTPMSTKHITTTTTTTPAQQLCGKNKEPFG